MVQDFKRVEASLFLGTDVTAVAQSLLGKIIVHRVNDAVLAAKIVETEAYSGVNDRACHAYPMKRTPATRVFYQRGGYTYVYLCYGLHTLLNIVTNIEGVPDVVLIRAVEPLTGMEQMCQNRGFEKPSVRLTNGPGILTQALGITRADSGLDLTTSDRLFIAETDPVPFEIAVGTRVGIASAGEDAFRPWRYMIAGNPYVSKAKGI